MDVCYRESGRIETGIVVILTVIYAAFKSYKINNCWMNEDLDKLVDTVDIKYNHALMIISQLKNVVILLSCLPVLYTITPSDTSACKKRRHGLLPFIGVHILSMIVSVNCMIISASLTDTVMKSTGDRCFTQYKVYLYTIVDAISLF